MIQEGRASQGPALSLKGSLYEEEEVLRDSGDLKGVAIRSLTQNWPVHRGQTYSLRSALLPSQRYAPLGAALRDPTQKRLISLRVDYRNFCQEDKAITTLMMIFPWENTDRGRELVSWG